MGEGGQRNGRDVTIIIVASVMSTACRIGVRSMHATTVSGRLSPVVCDRLTRIATLTASSAMSGAMLLYGHRSTPRVPPRILLLSSVQCSAQCYIGTVADQRSTDRETSNNNTHTTNKKKEQQKDNTNKGGRGGATREQREPFEERWNA